MLDAWAEAVPLAGVSLVPSPPTPHDSSAENGSRLVATRRDAVVLPAPRMLVVDARVTDVGPTTSAAAHAMPLDHQAEYDAWAESDSFIVRPTVRGPCCFAPPLLTAWSLSPAIQLSASSLHAVDAWDTDETPTTPQAAHAWPLDPRAEDDPWAEDASFVGCPNRFSSGYRDVVGSWTAASGSAAASSAPVETAFDPWAED